MNEEEKKETIKWKGWGKMALGALSFIPGMGVGIATLGLKACVVGGICRVGGWLTGSKTLSNFGKNIMSMGVKTFVAGAAMSIPFAGGAALFIEGAYNAKTGKQLAIKGYEIGFEPMARKIARFVSRVPQFGDPNYEHSPTGWQSSTPPAPNPEIELANRQHQQQQYTPVMPNPNSTHDQTQQQSAAQQPQQSSPQHQAQSQPKPAEKSASVDIESVATQASYEKASEAYTKQVEETGVKKFEVQEIKQDGENTIVTYRPPGYTKENCPPDLLVNQHFNKAGELIKVDAGQNATCITPPVKQADGSFEIHSYQDGKAKDEKVAARAQSIQHATQARQTTLTQSNIRSSASSEHRRGSSISSL